MYFMVDFNEQIDFQRCSVTIVIESGSGFCSGQLIKEKLAARCVYSDRDKKKFNE